MPAGLEQNLHTGEAASESDEVQRGPHVLRHAEVEEIEGTRGDSQRSVLHNQHAFESRNLPG